MSGPPYTASAFCFARITLILMTPTKGNPMIADILLAIFVVSGIALMLVLAVAPPFLTSLKDLKEASVNLHGQGR
jgi:hypothetical protein